VPRLLLACSHFNTIAAEVQERGLGFHGGGLLEGHFGVAADFGWRLIAAIKEASPRSQWDFAGVGNLGDGVKAERPKIKPPLMLHFAPDHRPPLGYSGVWPPEAYER
jgi:hypothetical protein